MEIVEKNGRTHILAGEGKRVSNGDGVYALDVALGVGDSPEGYYEISEEECEAIRKENEENENGQINY